MHFGYDADPEGDLGFFQADGENTFSELVNMVSFISPGALTIAANINGDPDIMGAKVH